MTISMYRMPEVKTLSGYSRSTIYLRISDGLWVTPVKLGARAIGFPSNEVSALIAARIAGKSEDEIRELVIKLEGERKNNVDSHESSNDNEISALTKLIGAYENGTYSSLTEQDFLALVKRHLIHPDTAARLAEEVKNVHQNND